MLSITTVLKTYNLYLLDNKLELGWTFKMDNYLNGNYIGFPLTNRCSKQIFYIIQCDRFQRFINGMLYESKD